MAKLKWAMKRQTDVPVVLDDRSLNVSQRVKADKRGDFVMVWLG
jgi:hypothetical protein